jgi:hypothetical protein
VAARRLEGEVELALDLVAHAAGEPDLAGLAQGLDPGRHVHAVAVDRVPVHDHVAEVDADPVADALVLGHARLALGHRALDLDRGLDRGDDAAELDDGAVALEVDDPPAVPHQDRLDHLLLQRPEPRHRAGLVPLDEPAVAGHVRRHDGGEPALDPPCCHPPPLPPAGTPARAHDSWAAPPARGVRASLA